MFNPASLYYSVPKLFIFRSLPIYIYLYLHFVLRNIQLFAKLV